MRHGERRASPPHLSGGRLPRPSERWLRLLLRLYPADFREEMGEAMIETYLERCDAAERRGGRPALAGVWLLALADSARNGLAERARPAVRWRRGGNWGRDTERAVRRLARAPLFTLSMLATLTVGLGAFATVYAVVQKVLLAPLPYERPQELHTVWRDLSAIVDLKRGNLGGPDVPALQAAGGVIVDAVALDRGGSTLSRAGSGAGEASPEEISLLYTSHNLFRLLGVRPMLGRGFTPDEEGPGRPPLLVLGHDLWRGRLGGDSAIVGADVLLNGQPFRVIGVMGPEFRFLAPAGLGAPQPVDAYVTHPVSLAEADPGDGSYAGIVRVRPGTPPEAAQAAVDAVGRMVDRRDFEGRGIRLHAVGFEHDLTAAVRQPLLILGAAGVLLVLVLTVNMATLLIVRASHRDREFAVSRALGANPLALARATLLEAALLGLLGGMGGALLAVWGTRALVALAPLDLPRRETIAVDWPIAAVVVLVGLLLGLLAGAAPAVWATRAKLSTLLRAAAVRGGGAHGPLRRAMVVVQVALSLVLLSTGALLVRSFERLLRTDPGFAASGVLTLRVPIPVQRFPGDSQALVLHERLQRELAALPGVEATGATTALPLTSDASQTTVTFPGAPGNRGSEEMDAPLVDYVMARAGYFESLGIELLDGRLFGAAHAAGVREAVIDRTLAERFFPGGSAVGATVRFLGDSVLVVGVAEHARMDDVHQDGRPQIYLRDEDYTSHSLTYVLRSRRSLPELVPEVRAAVGRVDPQLAVSEVQTMQDIVDGALRQPRLSAVLLSAFSIGALMLAAMGLYGVVAGAVSRRRHEIAVRLALGADHRRVLRLVLGEGARLVVLGLLVAAPGIYVAGRLLGGMLVGISSFDVPTLAAVALGLGVVATVACVVPARRVAGIEPAQSLREG